MLPALEITGLVLAGGLGRRMGGVDKGLLIHAGTPLAQHALERLAPQVGAVALSANRNLADYWAIGAPVWPDRLQDRPGPLAGLLTGLERSATRYVVTVPCDAPFFPTDLVARLAAALMSASADVAVAVVVDAAGERTVQPVFCLSKTSLASDLNDFLACGGRRVGEWIARQRHAEAVFTDPDAFVNLNTPDDLRRASAA